MAPGRRGFKRESTIAGGLLTPDESFASRSTVTPKRESIDLTSIDDYQEAIQPLPYNSNHGLPNRDEGYSTLAEQQRRSESVSVRTSCPPPNRQDQAHNTVHNGHESAQSRSISPRMPTGGEGLQVLGRDVNRLVSLIDKLRRIGLKSVDGALPELVLVGDQSAGKSSLMGAIAEINLPKGQSMCTRCPTNIKTSPAPEWECTVSLQEDHTYEPTRKSGQAFPNWVAREGMMSRLFKTIDNKTELEEVLTWAQIALLNPSKDHETFIPGTREHSVKKQRNDYSTEAQFSPNVIAVEIRGPSLPALSFYDLPGLFQAAEDPKQQFLVKVFEDLTIKYIKHPNAIIICTITMQNDPGLSRTKALITKYKAEDKCIGVLTMPDRLQSESTHKDYDNILRKKTYVLPRGYYVTKQPGPDSQLARENYHAIARQQEEHFFNNSIHWGQNGAWAEFRERCGTGTIQKYLSKEFARQILNSIPDLTGKINAQTQDVDEELALLPEIPNDKVQHIVRQRLVKFSNEVQRILDGSSVSNNNKFHSEWTKLCRQFLKATEFMRPGCICNHPSDKIKEVINIDDSDNESVISQRPMLSVKRHREGSENPNQNSKRPRYNDSPIHINIPTTPGRPLGPPQTPGSRQTVKQENGLTPQKMSAPVMASQGLRKLKDEEIGPFRQKYLDSGYHAMTIGDIKESIEENGRAGVPDYVSHKVKEDYALQAVQPWDGPLRTFIDCTFNMLREQVLSTLSIVLEQHQHTGLYKKSKAHIEEFLTQHEKEQRAASMEFYEVEKCGLFTINEEAFNRHKAEALDALRSHRRLRRVHCYTEKHFHGRFNGDVAKETAAKDKFKKEVTDEQLGRDPFERELDVAAYIRGYYTTARFRFTDSVCANMHTKYFQKIAREIDYLLEEKFGLDQGDGENTCVMLLEGSAEISQRRINLKNRKAQLIEFSRTLDQLRNDTFADDDGNQSDLDPGLNSANDAEATIEDEQNDEEADDSAVTAGPSAMPNPRRIANVGVV